MTCSPHQPKGTSQGRLCVELEHLLEEGGREEGEGEGESVTSNRLHVGIQNSETHSNSQY